MNRKLFATLLIISLILTSSIDSKTTKKKAKKRKINRSTPWIPLNYYKELYTFTGHVWLITSKENDDQENQIPVVLFYVYDTNCKDWEVTVRSDLTIFWRSDDCHGYYYSHSDFKAYTGEYEIQQEIETGSRTWKTGRKLNLKVINNSGKDLDLYWINKNGQRIKY